MDEYDRSHMDVSAEDAKGSTSSELDKTSLKNAVDVFNKTFMQDLWVTIRYTSSCINVSAVLCGDCLPQLCDGKQRTYCHQKLISERDSRTKWTNGTLRAWISKRSCIFGIFAKLTLSDIS